MTGQKKIKAEVSACRVDERAQQRRLSNDEVEYLASITADAVRKQAKAALILPGDNIVVTVHIDDWELGE
jgi:predicted house-cleaning NTP pyrophosphatase (Maf/HAM1 superfamily)